MRAWQKEIGQPKLRFIRFIEFKFIEFKKMFYLGAQVNCFYISCEIH
jgi:hypothetical protein